MDEVLFQLSTVSLRDDRIDDARGYLRKLICGYPSSDQARLAFERLEKIGFGAWQGCEKVKPLTQGQLTGAQPSRLHGLKGGSEDAWAPVSDRGLGNTFG
jgi:hypothetical protein